ncbi:hypothetical protein FE65_14960, partial [Staphylococcus aureus]
VALGRTVEQGQPQARQLRGVVANVGDLGLVVVVAQRPAQLAGLGEVLRVVAHDVDARGAGVDGVGEILDRLPGLESVLQQQGV